jgi:hypothetical protein
MFKVLEWNLLLRLWKLQTVWLNTAANLAKIRNRFFLIKGWSLTANPNDSEQAGDCKIPFEKNKIISFLINETTFS